MQGTEASTADALDGAPGPSGRPAEVAAAPDRRKVGSFVRDVAAKVGPAVVRIDLGPGQRGIWGFKDMLEHGSARGRPGGVGQGSGIVFDGPRGLVVTNAHVVKGAESVAVTSTDGRERTGAVVATDPVFDLAVIALEPGGPELPAAEFGNSDALEMGDWAIAVGNPFGLSNSVTLGIISNLRRTSAELGLRDKRMPLLQTDAAINPGNSGGPLLNEHGEVIGINTAMHRGAGGIGFAIPINDARATIEALARGEPKRYSYLGIEMTPVPTRSAAAAAGPLGPAGGIVVTRVLPGSPAARARLKHGDIITAVNDVPVPSTLSMQAMISGMKVGQPVRMSIVRGEQEFVVQAAVADLSASQREEERRV